MISKPRTDEYPPRFEAYIGLINENNLIQILWQDLVKAQNFFSTIVEEKITYRYAEGKWSVKEILMHLNYVERIMSFRAFAASRGDEEALFQPINHTAFFINSNVESQSMTDLLNEFDLIRNHTIHLFSSMSEKQSMLKGSTGENAVSARALGFSIAGHAKHHITVIKERYLQS